MRAGSRCFPPIVSLWMHGTIIWSIREVQDVSRTKTPEPKPDQKEPVSVHAQRADEAMRQATEDATKGPREARSGRFDWKPKPKAAE